MPTEPKWNNEDPQRWSTRFEAWYQIGNAKPVCINGYCNNEVKATSEAEAALQEALKQVKELGLTMHGKAWTVKVRTRTQIQRWPEANLKEFSVALWYGSLSIVLKSLLKEGEAIARRRD